MKTYTFDLKMMFSSILIVYMVRDKLVDNDLSGLEDS
jgi:hypothetical protein